MKDPASEGPEAETCKGAPWVSMASLVRSLVQLRHPNFVAYLDWFAGPNGLDREVYLVPSSTVRRCSKTLLR